MIKINIYGGLGNQMFQYALGRHLSLKLGTKLHGLFIEAPRAANREYNLWCFKLYPEFNVEVIKKRWPRLYKRIPALKELFWRENFANEKSFTFDPDILNTPDGSTLDGVWQSEKYFKDIEGTIRSDFSFKKDLSGRNLETARQISNSDSISVHIRRGDYVTDKSTNAYHGVCGLDYYQKCISYIKKFVESPKFFIFSDDIEWAKDNLKLGKEGVFIDWNKGEYSYTDMQLMSLCKHNIIANSSFSWWGAWLNNNPKKIVLAPKKWFEGANVDTRDLISEGWIRL